LEVLGIPHISADILHPASIRTTGTVTFQSTACHMYRGPDKFLALPTSPCILFDGENISFAAGLVIYINSTNTPSIMIINRIYETQNLLSL
jgi:hypothetical protein